MAAWDDDVKIDIKHEIKNVIVAIHWMLDELFKILRKP